MNLNSLAPRASSLPTTILRRPITPRSQPQVLRRARPQRRHKSNPAERKASECKSTPPHSQQFSHQSTSSGPSRPPDTIPAVATAAGAPATLLRSRGFRDVIKASPIGTFGRWYARVQERKPYTTQFWSAIVIYLCGDLSAQMFFPSEVPAPAKEDGNDAQGGGETVSAGYDPLRTLRHLCVGAGSSIPSYNWFMFLGNHFNYPSKFLSILTKVVVQQTCFTPVFNTYFFSMQSLLAGATLEETWERLKKALPVSVTNSVKLWPVVTAFSFMYVPAQFRNVFSGCVAVGWQTYLSWLNQKAAKEVAAAEALAAAEGMGSVAGMSCPERIEDLDSSDYGSDFTPDEEDLLNNLLSKAVAEHATDAATSTPTWTSTPTPIERITAPKSPELAELESLQPTVLAALVADIEDGIEPPVVRLPKVLGREGPLSPWRQSQPRPGPAVRWNPSAMGRSSPHAGNSNSNRSSPSVEHSNSTEGREKERERNAARELEWTRQSNAVDTRSPVERFRRAPNKAFSVTDLVSPAWCELQYWYTLTKHGRKRRTPAMKKGSSMHKTLEDEIYTTVPVEITTKEDAWGLRIWNVIQGLRMLREYGITRELEVWGVVDGEIVNGVIDQLSYECPDSELEATAAGYYADAVASRAALPEYQMSLSDYLLSSSQGGMKLSDLGQNQFEEMSAVEPELPAAVHNLPRIYLTDVKTKASRSLPTVKSSGFRPTLLQLQLYYHMLNRLITSDDVTINILAARYGFDVECPFTKAFVSEVGGLNDQFFDAVSSQESEQKASPPSASQDSTSMLMTHNNLSRLWSLMIDQMRLTFLPETSLETQPIAPSIPSVSQPELLEEYPTLLSPVLTARYLSSTANEDLERQLLGSRSFLFDPTTLTSYLTDQMTWWNGQRDPRGVDIMDAWKCRICEFRDECSWRQERELAYARRGRGQRAGSADI
ncbi:Major facilitator superfamily domain general substrate transporter [Penicillium paradoxum]|uniref:Major facilitator superfamily domain general substrate transporter n=1 Tax=Penicillium paradoxum TaxID=176176 RepID=UPI0025480A61|nr:Major facilitator superfamily domain general substrate transporter [Penicillium paradoxum]KAJ5774846.1 Major facilitator superfamily domain general substrate transporter [Penicillium paradoxum]